MNGDHPDRDDLVAYSLGALDPREAGAIEAHAPSCARCMRELEALAPAIAVLGESVEQMEPPPELRERVLGIVREEAEAKQAEISGAEKEVPDQARYVPSHQVLTTLTPGASRSMSLPKFEKLALVWS